MVPLHRVGTEERRFCQESIWYKGTTGWRGRGLWWFDKPLDLGLSVEYQTDPCLVFTLFFYRIRLVKKKKNLYTNSLSLSDITGRHFSNSSFQFSFIFSLSPQVLPSPHSTWMLSCLWYPFVFFLPVYFDLTSVLVFVTLSVDYSTHHFLCKTVERSRLCTQECPWQEGSDTTLWVTLVYSLRS